MRVSIPLLLVWADHTRDHFEPTYTLSISWFGCTVRSKEFFRIGQEVQLRRDDGNTIAAEVIYCLGDHSDKNVEVGLKFEEDGRGFWEMPVWKDQ